MFVGIRQMQVKDELNDITFPVLVQYPTAIPSTPAVFGPFTMDVSGDAPIAEGSFTLVIISHGNGGSHLLYRTISSHLAKNGYIVAMLEHYGNNRNNNELDGADKNLTYRTRHVRLTMDAVSNDPRFITCIQPDIAAIIGHSIGGCTALAVAGGTPWSRNRQRIEVESDSRVRALVLLAPATDWYLAEDSLRNVNVPILMLFAGKDRLAPHCQPEVVLNGVADKSKVTCRVIENAGHFSFISPYPPHMKNPGFHPSTDPEGFDREKFHEKLPGEILDYLDKKLKD
jgi:predicted dienelactone hydrolase